jgi:hypothetical protein
MRLMKAVVLATLTTLGCGGGSDNGDPTGPPPGGATNGTLTAQINGTTWNATGTITVSRQQNNFIGLAGSGFAGNTAYSLVIGIANATGPGSHSLNVFSGGDGSSLIVGGTQTGWGTAFQGGSGTLIITSLTTNRIVGTFSGTLIPTTAGAGNMTIANGSFDVTF